MMRTTVLVLTLFAALPCLSQVKAQEISIRVPLKPGAWEFKPETVEFLEYQSRPCMKLLTSGGQAILKDLDFSDGTIEFDMIPEDPMFASFYFRWKDPKENECFYFRTELAGNPQAVNAVQYAPFIDGVNLWDMLFHFQSNAGFSKDDWNHVKLVISGKQMRVYVNDMNSPVLRVPYLEGNTGSGTLGFAGRAIISNLEVKPGEVEGLSPEAGEDPAFNDSRYLRKWQVSQPVTTADSINNLNDLLNDLNNYRPFPDSTTSWSAVTAERRGMINLTRKFGGSRGRRIAWLKTSIHSSTDRETNLRLGFSDEVWVFINGMPLYFDKNIFGTPIMKHPKGRLSLENASFRVPLKEGDNELLIGVAGFFYGWGIVARLDDLADLKIEN